MQGFCGVLGQRFREGLGWANKGMRVVEGAM